MEFKTTLIDNGILASLKTLYLLYVCLSQFIRKIISYGLRQSVCVYLWLVYVIFQYRLQFCREYNTSLNMGKI